MEYRTERSDLYLRQERLRNTRELLWPVDLDITLSDGRVQHIDMVCALQPDKKVQGKWYIRLPDWSIKVLHTTEELYPLHNCVTKTRMRQFFTDQRMVLKAEAKGTMHELLLGSLLMESGQLVPFSHEPFSEEQRRYYILENARVWEPTAHVLERDSEAGADPLDRHRPGKKSRRQLIEGELPIDVGSVYIDWDEGSVDLDTKGRDDQQILADLTRDGRIHLMDYTSKKQRERRFNSRLTVDAKPELMCVGHPSNFSTVKRMSTIFRVCKMPKDVRQKFKDRLWNAPYWRVKDKKRERWYVYSYDWRLDRRKFAHSVIPIGHIEPSRRGSGYYFCMYSHSTLEQRNNQSLYIADYRVKLTEDLCTLLELDYSCVGEYLCWSVYNDWAMHTYRELTASPSHSQLLPSLRQSGALEHLEQVITHA